MVRIWPMGFLELGEEHFNICMCGSFSKEGDPI